MTKWEQRTEDDAELRNSLEAYYKANPDERMANVAPAEKVFRYRTTEAFLASGTPLSVCDMFRPLLQRAGFSLTAATHLTVFIPKIEAVEMNLLISELADQYVGIAFDGTTRLGEAVNTTGRWCPADFHLRKRLLDFTTLETHMNNVQLAAHETDVIVRQCRIPPPNVVCFARDSVSANGAACRRLQVAFANAVDMLCLCHTCCHVGDNFDLPTLKEWMTPWLELVGGRNPHAGAKLLWKETVAPAAVPGYSKVRWYAKAEIQFVIAEAGRERRAQFLDTCNERDYGDATRTSLNNINTTKTLQLDLEFAAMLDVRVLVSTTYELEGDRLEILIAYDRIEKLRTLGRALNSKQDGLLLNVDGVLRLQMKLKKGVTVEKFFRGHGIATGANAC